jgi:uncharacterized membrane protein
MEVDIHTAQLGIPVANLIALVLGAAASGTTGAARENQIERCFGIASIGVRGPHFDGSHLQA